MKLTPRVKAHIENQIHTYSPSVGVDFACELECKLNAVNRRIAELEAAARALVDAIHASGDVDISQQVNALAEALESKP